MQVFVPFPCIIASTRCLDPKRLGNQVYRECLTLIRGGWPNHPASKMWRGHRHALAMYALAGLDELQNRGRDYPHHREYFESVLAVEPDTGFPAWWGDMAVHRSHQSNLVRKDHEWYSPFFPGVSPDLEYVWRV